MTTNSNIDTTGQKIIQKHAPFFSPSKLAQAIDDAIAQSNLALLDRLEEQAQMVVGNVFNPSQMLVPLSAIHQERNTILKDKTGGGDE